MSNISEDVKCTIDYSRGKNVPGYGRIYSTSNEDIQDLYSNVDFKDKKVLSVLASGDQAFMAHLKGARKVDLFDINKLAFYYYYIRVWTMKYFNTFYPEPYLCRKFVESLLTRVKPMSKEEEDCINYWKGIISRLSEYDFMTLFFSRSTVIQLNDEKINKLKNILENNESKFYNTDISKDSDIKEQYDIVITSNIVDWVCAADGSLSEYKKNLSKLVSPKGIILSSNISQERPNPCERYYFDDEFDYYEISGNNSLNYSPGYMFIKR